MSLLQRHILTLFVRAVGNSKYSSINSTIQEAVTLTLQIISGAVMFYNKQVRLQETGEHIIESEHLLPEALSLAVLRELVVLSQGSPTDIQVERAGCIPLLIVRSNVLKNLTSLGVDELWSRRGNIPCFASLCKSC